LQYAITIFIFYEDNNQKVELSSLPPTKEQRASGFAGGIFRFRERGRRICMHSPE
jgi:hypothetical protein